MGLSQPSILADLYQNIAESGRWQLTLVVVAYGLVVYSTNRILITTPACYNLFAEVDRARVELLLNETAANDRSTASAFSPAELFRSLRRQPPPAPASQTGGGGAASAQSVVDTPTGEPDMVDNKQSLIDSLLERAASRVGRDVRRQWRIRTLASLARVLVGRRYLHAAEQLMITYSALSAGHRRSVLSEAVIITARLEQIGSPESVKVKDAIDQRLERLEELIEDNARKALLEHAEGMRVLLSHARRIVDDAEDTRLERAAEDQRRVLWLVFVGLLVIFVFGLTGHRELMLFGALGGLLAPLTTKWQRNDDNGDERPQNHAEADAEYVKSWGALLLGPVAGALAAYGGVLLVNLLSDPDFGVLGDFFQRNSWIEPSSPGALAIALLFGFSGGLFGKIALRASAQVLPPGTSEPLDPETSRPDEKPTTQDEPIRPSGPGAPIVVRAGTLTTTISDGADSHAGQAEPASGASKRGSTLTRLADLAGAFVNMPAEDTNSAIVADVVDLDSDGSQPTANDGVAGPEATDDDGTVTEDLSDRPETDL